MEDPLGIIGFCHYCNRPVTKETGFFLNPNPMGNAYDTAKPAHKKCHLSQEEELPLGLGDESIYMKRPGGA